MLTPSAWERVKSNELLKFCLFFDDLILLITRLYKSVKLSLVNWISSFIYGCKLGNNYSKGFLYFIGSKLLIWSLRSIKWVNLFFIHPLFVIANSLFHYIVINDLLDQSLYSYQ